MRTVGTPWSHVQETGTVFDQMREKFHESTVYTAINDRSPTHPHIAKPDKDGVLDYISYFHGYKE